MLLLTNPEIKCQEFFSAPQKKDADFTRFPGLRGFEKACLKCIWLLGLLILTLLSIPISLDKYTHWVYYVGEEE